MDVAANEAFDDLKQSLDLLHQALVEQAAKEGEAFEAEQSAAREEEMAVAEADQDIDRGKDIEESEEIKEGDERSSG